MAQDVVRRSLAHARQSGHFALVDGLFDALNGADSQFLGNQHGALGADAGDGHQGQDAVGEFGQQSFVSVHPAGEEILLGLFANCLADAGDFLQVHCIPNGLFQGER